MQWASSYCDYLPELFGEYCTFVVSGLFGSSNVIADWLIDGFITGCRVWYLFLKDYGAVIESILSCS